MDSHECESASEDSAAPDALYTRIGSWHGTGRYRYEGEGVVDTLQSILAQGALLPSPDEFDQKRGSAHSVSLARARAYGRLYASLYFPKRELRLAEYHRRVWACGYFFLSSLALGWFEYRLPHRLFSDFKRKAAVWSSKFTKEKLPIFGIFVFSGTDIAGNYPMLIGIRRDTYTSTRGSRFIDLHEDRSEDPIPLARFTHLEVPACRIEETRQVLRAAGHDMPVVALETGDRSRSQLRPYRSPRSSR